MVLNFHLALTTLLAVSVKAISQPSGVNQFDLVPYFRHNDTSQLVPDSYIIKFRDNYTLQYHLDSIGVNISSLGHNYYHLDILPGYHIKANQSIIDNLIRRDRGVEWVEHSARAYAPKLSRMSPINQRNLSSSPLSKRYKAILDDRAPFPLVMQSSSEKLNQRSSGAAGFWYWDKAGENVDIYVLDTGMNINHWEFGIPTRATNFRDLDVSPYVEAGDDPRMVDSSEVSHGTCVASLIGGDSIGAARSANLINLKVIGANVTVDEVTDYPNIVKAFGEVRKTHNRKKRACCGRPPFAGSLINLSLGGVAYSESLKTAIRKLKNAGILVVTSAGNSDTSTHRYVPCSYDDTICVASVDNQYRKASYSNYGQHVTVSAPGDNVICASKEGTFLSYVIASGTSLSTAYVTGILAHFISYENIHSNAELVLRRMRDNWNFGFLEGFDAPQSRVTPNTFINNGFQNPNKSPTQPYFGAPSARHARRRGLGGESPTNASLRLEGTSTSKQSPRFLMVKGFSLLNLMENLVLQRPI
ncbi:subtilisin-like protein [Viridothelium virens]|uniref:Subtilisin-like protein n=1 Tax=Viridothelium virens TaxID=1048519 RepID=A0A6A6H4S0_VIRVR|nr:subtilisin-like protein [Viridothelium virens]